MNVVLRWYHIIEVPDDCSDPEAEALGIVRRWHSNDFRDFIDFEDSEIMEA